MPKPNAAPVTLPKGIIQRGDTYRVSVQVAGKRTTGTALTLTDAIRMVEQIKSGAFTRTGENSTLKTWTLEEAWDAYIEYRTATSKKATPQQFAWYGRLIMEQFGKHTSLDLIKGVALTKFFDELTVTRNYSASLVNYTGTLLVQMQRYAYERGRMSFTPERMKGRKLTKGRTRFLTKEEEVQALDWFQRTAREQYADLFIFYVDTGCRKTEALNLKWSDVDLRTGRITIWQTKNGEPRTVRMTKRVAHILKGLKLTSYRSPSQKIFEDISERKFYRVWHEMKDALGLSDDKQFVIHMLRHTCCTRLLGAGVDIRSVMEWMGHSSIDITQRYAHFIPSKLDDAVSALDRASESD
jgi:integrase